MDIVLEEGEVICSRCDGRGCTPFVAIDQAQETCSKCNGEGKLDWISNAMSKEPDKRWFDEECEIVKAMAEKLREDIDKEIMKNIYGDYNEGTETRRR